jgi:hypothetical protein
VKKYVVAADRPVMTHVSLSPLIVDVLQLRAVPVPGNSGDVEYRTVYLPLEIFPRKPSSPGAVQESLTEESVASSIDKAVIAAGG